MSANAHTDDVTLALSLFNAFAAGDLDRWQKLLTPNFTFAYPGMPEGRGADAARAYNQPFADAFSDWHTDLHHWAKSGDGIFLLITVHATHSRPLVTPAGALPPSGRRGAVKAVLFAEIVNGHIQHEATYWNVPDLVAQIAPV